MQTNKFFWEAKILAIQAYFLKYKYWLYLTW